MRRIHRRDAEHAELCFCEREIGIWGGLEAAGGIGLDGKAGDSELYAAVGEIHCDGGQGGPPGVVGGGEPGAGGESVGTSERRVHEESSGFRAAAENTAAGGRGPGLSLLFPNGSRIVGAGDGGDGARISAVSLLLIDEAARVPDGMYKALRPMLAVKNGDLWLMSTPYGQRGFFWDAWANGGERWERVSVPATECSRIPGEFLEEERLELGAQWFAQEYMCAFVDNGSGWFSREGPLPMMSCWSCNLHRRDAENAENFRGVNALTWLWILIHLAKRLLGRRSRCIGGLGRGCWSPRISIAWLGS